MKRYKFLIRLAIVFVLVLFVPLTVVLGIFWQRSATEMQENSDAYYSKLNESFMIAVQDELTAIKSHATSVIVHTKDPASVFWNGEKNWASNPYWYYEAGNEVHDLFPERGIVDFGIYYYADDSVFTRNCRQSRDSYLHNTLMLPGNEYGFFDESSWHTGGVLFSTTNTDDAIDGDMLVGFCVSLGRYNDKALIFYRLSTAGSDLPMAFLTYNTGVEFYVLDSGNDRILMALREHDDSLPPQNELTRYCQQASGYPLSFAVRVLADSQQERMNAYYSRMQLIWFLSIVILFPVTCLGLYLSYRPLHLLMKEMDAHQEGELETIRNELHIRDTKIRDQRIMVISLLVDHLLYGGHISHHRLRDMGLDVASDQLSCVFLIEGEIFLTGETEQLSKAAEQRFGIRLFITNMEDEPKNVAIAFLHEDNSDEIAAWIQHWLRNNYSADYTIVRGKTVSSLDDIRSSFISCYRKENDLADLSTAKKDLQSIESKEDRRKQLEDDVLTYLEQHYCEADLSQGQVAEAFQISTYALSRMFKAQMGVGFTEYINAKRIELAKDLLRETNETTKDIAIQVGLPNYNYFLRLFKTITGQTPSAYRTAAQMAKD